MAEPPAPDEKAEQVVKQWHAREEEAIRAARALLNWTQQDLVAKSGLSFTTIKRMESIGTGRSSADNVDAVQKALEAGGVAFIAENGGGAA